MTGQDIDHHGLNLSAQSRYIALVMSLIQPSRNVIRILLNMHLFIEPLTDQWPCAKFTSTLLPYSRPWRNLQAPAARKRHPAPRSTIASCWKHGQPVIAQCCCSEYIVCMRFSGLYGRKYLRKLQAERGIAHKRPPPGLQKSCSTWFLARNRFTGLHGP